MATIVVTSSDHAVADIIRRHLSHWLMADIVTVGPSDGDLGAWITANVPNSGALVVVLRPSWTQDRFEHLIRLRESLIAALKVKTEHPEAVIMYVRPQNRRGDARHPSHALAEDTQRSKSDRKPCASSSV